MAKVYVPNRSHHDFTLAEQFGELVYLTEGFINRFQINHIFRLCSEAMKESGPDDFILISSLSILNAAAASIMARRHGKVNFLVFDRNKLKYTAHTLIVEPKPV